MKSSQQKEEDDGEEDEKAIKQINKFTKLKLKRDGGRKVLKFQNNAV